MANIRQGVMVGFELVAGPYDVKTGRRQFEQLHQPASGQVYPHQFAWRGTLGRARRPTGLDLLASDNVNGPLVRGVAVIPGLQNLEVAAVRENDAIVHSRRNVQACGNDSQGPLGALGFWRILKTAKRNGWRRALLPDTLRENLDRDVRGVRSSGNRLRYLKRNDR